MKKQTNKYITELEEQLASDDELPSGYDEVSDLPAYQNDNRFNTLEFPWLDNTDDLEPCGRSICSSSSSNNEEDLHHVNKIEELGKINHNKQIIKRGVLSKQDLFCVRSIVDSSSDDTLIWFINFLMYKDMQSKYKFLKSCLVEDIHNDYTSKYCSNGKSDVKRYKYDIVIKINND